MTDAFAWAPPIQRYEFAFLAEALGLPEDFSLPAHISALRATPREAGLAYRVELDEEGKLIARITSGHDVIGLAEVGDFDDALEAGCRALALALLDAYEKHILIPICSRRRRGMWSVRRCGWTRTTRLPKSSTRRRCT